MPNGIQTRRHRHHCPPTEKTPQSSIPAAYALPVTLKVTLWDTKNANDQ